MVPDVPKAPTPLLPDRHPQQEMFLCDIADAVLKDDMASMEHPIFTLSKKPDLKPRVYHHNDVRLEVMPSSKGIATIYDKDILIYAISQLMAGKKAGRQTSRELIMSARDLLVWTNRETGGRNYELLEDALDRLAGTRLKTNIKTGGEATYDNFGLLESAHFRRDEQTNRLVEVRLVLSTWLYNAVCAQEVLTLHRDYFRLRKPVERRIYEIARKHCGQQAEWSIQLENLFKKTGSQGTMKRFRFMMNELAQSNHLPDYTVAFADDMVIFENRRVLEASARAEALSRLPFDAYDEAREAAPGWDPHVLESKWRTWMAAVEMDPPRDPKKAFVGFCRRHFEQNGRA